MYGVHSEVYPVFVQQQACLYAALRSIAKAAPGLTSRELERRFASLERSTLQVSISPRPRPSPSPRPRPRPRPRPCPRPRPRPNSTPIAALTRSAPLQFVDRWIPARFNTIFVAPQVAVQQIKQSSGATDASARFGRLCMRGPGRV